METKKIYSTALTTKTEQIKITPQGYELITSAPVATKDDQTAALARLKAAFPAVTDGTLLTVAEVINRKGISKNQLTQCVNHLIDTHKYNQFTAADLFGGVLLSVPLMTYYQAYKWAGQIPAPTIRKVFYSENTGSLWAKVTDLIAAGVQIEKL